MIAVQGITFGYPNLSPLFKDFNWQGRRGELWSVLGPSGCGKTSLLYLLAGLRRPQNGRVLIQQDEILRPRPHTGLILQEYGLLPWATVRENAALGLQIRGFYGPDGKHTPLDYRPDRVEGQVDYWLDRLELLAQAGQYPGQISGGQRQRTAIARTLVMSPDLLLMDEPFSSLDAPTRESLQDLTQELCKEGGITLVLVTHSIEEAAYMGQKILLFGQPPIHEGLVYENPGAGRPGYRNSVAYLELMRTIRLEMEME
jgi:NitT/TauT family transport system ATP-binding protein